MARFQARHAKVSGATLKFINRDQTAWLFTIFSFEDFILYRNSVVWSSVVFAKNLYKRETVAAQIHASNELFISQQAEIVSPRAPSCFPFT